MYLEDRTVRLQLWDTAGQVAYRFVPLSFFLVSLFNNRLKIGTVPKFDSKLH